MRLWNRSGSWLVVFLMAAVCVGCHPKGEPKEEAPQKAKEAASAQSDKATDTAGEDAKAAALAAAKADEEKWATLQKEMEGCPGTPSWSEKASASQWIPAEAPTTLLLDPSLPGRLQALASTMWSFSSTLHLAPFSGIVIATELDAEWFVGGTTFRLERVLAGQVPNGSLPGGGWSYGFGPQSPWCGKTGVACDLLGRVRGLRVGESVVRFEWDQGRLLRLVDSGGSKLVFGYYSDGQLKEAVLPDGQSISYLFGSGGMLESVKGPNGHVAYTYQGKERLLGTSKGGAKTTLKYDGQGRLEAVDMVGSTPWKVTYQPGTAGVRTTVANPGDKTRAVYHQFGKNSHQITDAEGNMTRKELDDTGRLLSLEEPGGRITRVVWDAQGRPVSVVLPGGALRRFEWGVWGLAAVTDGTRKVTLAYDESGRLKELQDEFGKVWSWTRDKCGRISRKQAGQEVSEYKYDLSGRMTQVTDGAGRTQKRTFDSMGRVIRFEDSARGAWKFTYDSVGRLSQQTDAVGQAEAFVWNGDGMLQESSDPAGRKTQYTYDQAGRLVEARRDGVSIQRVQYDDMGRPTSTFDGRVTTVLQWTEAGLLASSAADGALPVVNSYDAAGRLIKVVQGTEILWQATWDAAGRVGTETGRDGVPLAYEYDDLGRLVKRTGGSSGLTAKWEADGTGWLTEASGKRARIEPDPTNPLQWKPVEIVEPNGLKTVLTYTAEGWIAREQRSNGEEVTWEYDGLGRPLVWNSTWRGKTEYRWDTLGRLAEIKEPDGRRRELGYGPDGKLAWVKLGGEEYRYEWDAQGRLTALRNPASQQARFTYSATGSMEQVEGFDQIKSGATWTPGGLLAGWTTGDSVSQEFVRDGWGRLKEIQCGGKSLRRLGYTADGKVSSDSGPSHDVQYAYDSQKQMEALVDGKTFARLTFLRDPVGRPTQILGLGQTLASYEYDAQGQATSLKGPGTLGVKHSYDPQGRMLETQFEGGMKASYGRDDAGRISQETWFAPDGRQVIQLRYKYDTSGRLVGKSIDSQEFTYQYDSKGRLTSATMPVAGQEMYIHDAAGSLTQLGAQVVTRGPGQQAVAGPGGTRTYDGAGALLSRDVVGGDVGGAVIAVPSVPSSAGGVGGLVPGPLQFRYDPMGRLAEVLGGASGPSRFELDGDGNLVGWSDATSAQRFVLLQGRPLAALEKGDVKRTYLLPPFGEDAVGFLAEGQAYYYVRDLQGSVMALVDGSGKIVNRYLYSPFGRPLVVEESLPNPHRFLGRFTDSASGMVQFPARWMDPLVGSWAAPDLHPGELLRPESWNRYAFLENDPVNNVDPIGLQAFEWQAGSSSLDAVCGLFQQGKIKAVHAFGKALDGYNYVGAIEKGGWVHDVWVKNIPGTDRVMTIFRDLNEKSGGPYGKPNLTGNLIIPQTPAVSATPNAPAAAQSGSSLGQTLQNGYNAVKQGAQSYGKEISTTVAGLGGTMGTLSTPVGTLAVLPGGAAIIGAGVGTAAVAGGLVGTGLNQIPAVQTGAQAIIGHTMGYDKPQILVNIEKEGELKGPKMAEGDKKAIAAGLAKADKSGFPEPKPAGPAGGTLGLPPLPGQDGATTDGTATDGTGGKTKPKKGPGGGEADIKAPPDTKPDDPDTTDQPDGEGDKPDAETPPKDVKGDVQGIDGVTQVYISVPIRTEEDASYGEFKNIVTCVGTLSFWNVGALVDGKGAATMKFTCTASLNNVHETFTNSGTFSGGPNGLFVIQGEHNSGVFRMTNGQAITIPDAGTFANPNPAAFANWPK